MIEMQRIDGAPVCIVGDYYELLVFYEGDPAQLHDQLANSIDFEFLQDHRGKSVTFIEVKSAVDFDPDLLSAIAAIDSVQSVKVLKPVLPILSRADLKVPFISNGEMIAYNQDRGLALWELAIEYESQRGNISAHEVFEKMREIARVMGNSMQCGIKGTAYRDRILPAQAPKLKTAVDAGLLQDDIGNRITLYTTAMMDVKSSMGVIVAAPTAGSCGTLPGAILGAASFLELPEDEVVKALLAAGLIGVFIAAHSTFSAEVAGCMAETGAGGAMAAAGLTHLYGGTLAQALNAAAKALGASLGLVCDMIGDRVEVPCLDKNVAAAHKALAATNMALAGYTAVIPLDEVIDAMFLVGESMPRELCCTGLGGLAITPTGQNILWQLTSVDVGARSPGKFWKTC
jgi:L-serine dehydratase